MMYQNKLFIRCPKCGQLLEVDNSKNQVEKVCQCHNCNKKLVFRFGKKVQIDAASGQSDNGETFLQDNNDCMHSCCIVHDDNCFQLEIGINRIGRKASTSDANIQIETDDQFFSRSHIMITLSRLCNGSLKAVVRNDKNKNRTFVNEMELTAGDAIVLHDGNRIKMANTVVTFQSVSSSDGETIII